MKITLKRRTDYRRKQKKRKKEKTKKRTNKLQNYPLKMKEIKSTHQEITEIINTQLDDLKDEFKQEKVVYPSHEGAYMKRKWQQTARKLMDEKIDEHDPPITFIIGEESDNKKYIIHRYYTAEV